MRASGGLIETRGWEKWRVRWSNRRLTAIFTPSIRGVGAVETPEKHDDGDVQKSKQIWVDRRRCHVRLSFSGSLGG